MPRTSFDAHLEAIKTGRVLKTNVAGIRKALNAATRRSNGWSTSRTAPVVTVSQFNAMFDALSDHQPIVEGELHETGLAQVQNRRYQKQLARVTDILPDIVRFRLVDFEPIGARGAYFVPVYRAETEDGRGFRFINIPWQSGGRGPEPL